VCVAVTGLDAVMNIESVIYVDVYHKNRFKVKLFCEFSAEFNPFIIVMAYMLDVVGFWIIQSTGFSFKR
jgi:hypothetical protein